MLRPYAGHTSLTGVAMEARGAKGRRGGGVIPGERTEATLEAKRRVNSRDGAALSSRVIRVSG